MGVRRPCNRIVSSCVLAAAWALLPGAGSASEGRVGAPAPAATTLATTLPGGTREAAAAAFRTSGSVAAGRLVLPFPSLAVGLDDRWQLSLCLPQVAYRFGEAGDTEVVAAAGLGGLARLERVGWIVEPVASVEVRQPLGGGSLIGGVHGWLPVERGGPDARPAFATWAVAGTAGATWTFGERLTLTPGLAVHARQGVAPGSAVDPDDRELHGAVAFGSVVGVAGRRRPLIQLHLTRDLSIDGHLAFEWGTGDGRWAQLAGVGATWTF